MSTALTDVLIDLSDPSRLAEFDRDPDRYLSEAKLSAEDAAALRSRNRMEIRLRAKSGENSDPTQQFNRPSRSDLLIEIDPQIHLDLNANDQIAIGGQGLLFVDTTGAVYRGVPDASA